MFENITATYLDIQQLLLNATFQLMPYCYEIRKLCSEGTGLGHGWWIPSLAITVMMIIMRLSHSVHTYTVTMPKTYSNVILSNYVVPRQVTHVGNLVITFVSIFYQELEYTCHYLLICRVLYLYLYLNSWENMNYSSVKLILTGLTYFKDRL
jgi:hypothetical protein